jgi:hypothetical protein
MRAALLLLIAATSCNDPAAPLDLGGDFALVDEDLATPDLAVGIDAAAPYLLLPHAEWAQACQTLAGCSLWVGNTVSACIGDEQQPGRTPPLAPAVVACVVAAGANCLAAATCLNRGNPNVSCDPASDAPGCDGNTFTTCNQPGVRFSADCGALGYVCAGTTSPACSLDSCTGTESLCVGNFAGRCVGGRVVPRDACRMWTGAGCDVDAGACAGSGADCTTNRCSGSTLIACRMGHEVSFDCAQLGLTCVDDGAPRCGLGTECPASYRDDCNGSVLTFCDGGKLATFDCAAAGWSGCLPWSSNGGSCVP